MTPTLTTFSAPYSSTSIDSESFKNPSATEKTLLVPRKMLLVLDVTTARNKKSVRYFYVVIKPQPICCTLYRMQEILYGRVLKSR